MKIVFKDSGLNEGIIKISLDGGFTFTDYEITDVKESGILLDDSQDYEKIKAAAEYIRARVSLRPTIGLVLGSGLGGYADTLEDAVRIPYSEIPNFPIPTIPGHSGALVFGNKCIRRLFCFRHLLFF